MLHLLHPAALWTLVALALPLALHLRRPPPRTVRLGSLRFLENVSRRPVRRLRWREILLLCARLDLLAALSLLLAGTYWNAAPPAGPRRWALLDPTAAPGGDSLARWHAAQQAGYELRLLAPGFPTASAGNFPTAGTDNITAPDLWSLLREADAVLPGGSTLAVFSPGRLVALRGVRPALGHCKIELVHTPDAAADLSQEWVASGSGKRVLTGRSDAHSTVFTAKSSDGTTATQPAPPATSILILHDAEHTDDARYVEAAARAAADSVWPPANIQNRDITPDAENAAATDWVFWLSTRPVPDGLAEQAPRIVRYTAGDPVEGTGRIVAPSGDAADGVRLWRRTVAPPPGPAGAVLWRDGQGNPVLTYTHPSAGERWDVHTRFDPAWTDLPRTTALPAWLRGLFFQGAAAEPLHDRRLADPTQGLPSELPARAIPALAATDLPAVDLHWPLWILAALLFAVERCLSLRGRTPRLPVPSFQPELVASPR